MKLIVTSNVTPRMQTIAELLRKRAKVFLKVEAAQFSNDESELEMRFGQWRELTQQIEQLQSSAAE